jgi:hypothetical protein
MEMHQIRYFMAVSETLNLTKAAERCNVAQSSLTRAIKALEAELGGELLRRERNLSKSDGARSTSPPYAAPVLRNGRLGQSDGRVHAQRRGGPALAGAVEHGRPQTVRTNAATASPSISRVAAVAGAEMPTHGIKSVAAPLPLTDLADDVAAFNRSIERVSGSRSATRRSI